MSYGVKFDDPIDGLVLRSHLSEKPAAPSRESFVGFSRRGHGAFVSVSAWGSEISTPVYPGAYHYDAEAAAELVQIAMDYEQAIAPILARRAAIGGAITARWLTRATAPISPERASRLSGRLLRTVCLAGRATPATRRCHSLNWRYRMTDRHPGVAGPAARGADR